MNAPETNRIYLGDNRVTLRSWPDNFFDGVVTDPPYELGFMGKSWDSSGIAYDPALWAQVLRVMKPGAHLLAFGGTRTYHRMACAIEDAGFEIRDQMQWIYGSGFPKSLNVSKAIDKRDGLTRPILKKIEGAKPGNHGGGGGYRHGTERSVSSAASAASAAWEGWGTALKPANEPICVARKPLSEGTVAANVLRWGTGALNIDASRIKQDGGRPFRVGHGEDTEGKNTYGSGGPGGGSHAAGTTDIGRWPANVIFDEEAAAVLDAQSGVLSSGAMNGIYQGATGKTACFGEFGFSEKKIEPSIGGASRFFYCPKPSIAERNDGLQAGPADLRPRDEGRQQGLPGGDNPRNRGAQAVANFHPTVKPVDLMAYLIKLITPRGGVVLDPFLGSGTTAIAAEKLMTKWVGCEMSAEYVALAEKRIAAETEQGKLL